MQKGMSTVVSAVLVILISVVAITAVVTIGLPLIDRIKEAAVVEEGHRNMALIDNMIRQAATEGIGIVKSAQVSVTDGTYRSNDESETFDYNLVLKSDALQKGTFDRQGNLLTAVTGVSSASQNSTHLVIENEILQFVFERVGSESSFASLNTSGVVKTMTMKQTGMVIVPNDTSVIVSNISTTAWGSGYTRLAQEGAQLARAEVKAHLRSAYSGVEYDVFYTLPGSSDFLIIQVRNVSNNRTTFTYSYKLGFNSSNDVIRMGNFNETLFTVVNYTATGGGGGGGGGGSGSSNQTMNLDNSNWTRNSSSVTVAVAYGNVYYNASDGTARNISELANIGQGNWSYSSNSTHTFINFTLAGSDGYDYGIRDVAPGGSYWLDPSGNVYGRFNISNDFIRVGMTETGLWMYNSSGKAIFNTSFNDAVKVDGQNMISLYGSGAQNKTVYFFDWANQSWRVWTKGASNSTHGMPDWLDPRNKQAFKWKYVMRYVNGTNTSTGPPEVNLTYMMTTHDPFVRTFVDAWPRRASFEDEFSSNLGWVTDDSATFNVDTVNREIDFDTDSHDKKIYYDIGSNLSDDRWVMRFQFTTDTWSASSPNIQSLFFGLSDSTGGLSVNQDYLGFRVRSDSLGSRYEVRQVDNGAIGAGSQTNFADAPGVETFYIELVRESASIFTAKLYSDPGYSSLTESRTVATSSGVNNLRYIKLNSLSEATTNEHNGKIKNLMLWNGVSNVTSGQGNVTFAFSLPENKTSVTAAEPGLVGYWNFNEGSGPNATDSSGNAKNLGLINGPSWISNSSCRLGGCISLDGANDYLPHPGFNVPTGSISFWINPRSTSASRLVFVQDSEGDNPGDFHVRFDGFGTGKMGLEIQTGAGFADILSDSALTTGVWTHVAVLWGAGGQRMYINGILQSDTDSSTVGMTNPSATYRALGQRAGADHLNAVLDDFKIFDRRISQGEIYQLYLTGINQQKPGIYFTSNNASSEEVLFATTNWKNVNHSASGNSSSFNVTSNQTNWFRFDYAFNSTQNNNFMFTLGTMGRMNTTIFNPANNATAFSFETMESVANSTLTHYDIVGINATGGTVTYSNGYKIHTFTSSGTFTILSGAANVEYLVVGGGGGGGSNGGGGGGGGFVTGYKNMGGGTFTVTVGAGGARGQNGTNSVLDDITAYGGGAGGNTSGGVSPRLNGSAGGSGGGGAGEFGCCGSTIGMGGASIASQGNRGGNSYSDGISAGSSGGGGGAGAAGATPTSNVGGSGGSGKSSSISGTSTTYAGGGGGGGHIGGGGGGSGGGGAGGGGASDGGTAGTANTGGGGGGAWGGLAASGGSGIVIVRYLDRSPWTVTGPIYGISQHNTSIDFSYDGGAAAIWRLDEGSGGNATDSSGNGMTGTLNGPTWMSNSSCRYGACLVFDGTNDHATSGSAANWKFLHDGTTKTTVEFWVRRDGSQAAQEPMIIDTQGGTASNTGLSIYWGGGGSNDRLYYFLSDGTGSDTVTSQALTVSADVWTHVVMVWDQSTVKVYSNGALSSQTSASSFTPSSNNPTYTLNVGRNPRTGFYFKGALDDLRIYKRALTDTDVREHYQREVTRYYDDFGTSASGKTYRYFGVEDSNTTLQPVTPSGAVLHYRFNDNSTSNVTDSSGLNSGGSPTSGPTWMTNLSCKGGFGGCMSFDGSNDHILAPAILGNNNTVALWIYGRGFTNGMNYHATVTNTDGAQIQLYDGDNSNAKPRIAFNGVIGNEELEANRWYHIVAVDAANSLKVYINGTLDKSGSDGTQSQSSLVNIGRYRDGTFHCNCIMDEVIFINRSLSADEAYQLYLGGSQRHGGDLVGWWKFNDNTTLGPVLDSSGSGNTGNTTNGPTWMNNASCRIGGCLNLDGVNDYVDMGNASSTDFTGEDLTVSTWFRSGFNKTAQYVISRYTSGDTGGYMILLNGMTGYLSWRISDTSLANWVQLDTARTYNDGNWHHVAVTASRNSSGVYSTDKIKIYVDGTEASLRDTLSNGVVRNIRCNNNGGVPCSFIIGRESSNNNNYVMNGTVDNVKVWKRALTADEVRHEYVQTQDQNSIYGSIHRVAAADGLQSMAFNLTDKNNTFEGADYDMRYIVVSGYSDGGGGGGGGGQSNVTENRTYAQSACYTPANVSQHFLCSYDGSEFGENRLSGIVYAGDKTSFVTMCNDQTSNQTEAPYKFNVTSYGQQKVILPFSRGVCGVVGNKTSVIESQQIPATTFGTFELRGPTSLHLSLQYDRIKVLGDARFSKGTYNVCARKVGQDGNRVLVNVTVC